MAENDQRSYRDPPRWRSAEETPPAQADDPLAELARLIGQSVPMNKRDRRPAAPEAADDRRGQISRAASYPAPDEVLGAPIDDRYSTPGDEQQQQHVRGVDPDYRADRDDRYERAAREHPAPPSRGSRFRREPDFVVEPPRDVADGEAHEAAYQETADWHDPSSDERDSHYQGEYEDERYAADDHGYGDEYSEEQNTVRRSGFIFVAAIFALAVLGTAGAFAYRAMFGGPVLPALPPIIKAESGPNKIVPSGAGSQDGTARDADDNNAASRERLVSREERPVDITPPVTSAAPRSVSTVPVFPDPPSVGGPGAVVGYSGGPSSSNPAMPMPPASPAPPMPATTASNPSAGQVSPPAAMPSVSTVAPATPSTQAAPGPKKIRTVTIHTDQSSAPDGTAGSPASQAVAPRPGTQPPQASNGPLSIVPSSTEAAAAAVPARPRPAPAQPAPPKPAANEIASAAPVAPVATGGGYAVQVSSQRSEEEAQSSFRDLQAKYPDVLGGRTPIIRRADLGAKGIFFRAMVGPFASADQAAELCSNLKAAGGSCLVQKN
jgi:SPOR domain